MKFVISIIFLSSAHASPIRVFYETDSSRAQVVKTIFTENYKIPEELIGLKEISNCDDLREKGKLDLCLKNNGDLQVVSVDRGFISESLKIFQAP